MLLVGVYFAGRASMIPSLQAEKDRVTQARHAARAEIEKYEGLQRQLQQQIVREQLRPFIEAEEHNLRETSERLYWEYRRPFEEAEQHNLREMREQFEIEMQETER